MNDELLCLKVRKLYCYIKNQMQHIFPGSGQPQKSRRWIYYTAVKT
jgi:hypothetical protein